MSLPEVLVLALGLAMDATAVAGTRGLMATRVRVRDALSVALFFGGAQGVMPWVGWCAGDAAVRYTAGWSHWGVFLVLSAIGAKMIHEARHPPEESRYPDGAPFAFPVLGALAVATSIDALAAGVTLAIRGVDALLACTTISIVTGVLSFAGVYAGRRFGVRLGRRLDVIGGVTLIALGFKGLVQHYLAG
jgi:putative Mn2+ efflux pump MntP